MHSVQTSRARTLRTGSSSGVAAAGREQGGGRWGAAGRPTGWAATPIKACYSLLAGSMVEEDQVEWKRSGSGLYSPRRQVG